MKTLIIGTVLALTASANALASATFASVHVSMIRVDINGWGMVFFDAPATGARPSCVDPTYAQALAFDSNTAGGKAILATATSAKAQGSTMDVFGTGVCGTYNGTLIEDWFYGVQY
jgi:hypothetical protein